VLTRRDQVQAYRFAQARVQAALLSGQPDRIDVPLRRQRFAAFIGVMLAVLIVCGFGVVGLLNPGGKAGWAAKDTLVVERETGARFVFDPTDGALHPVLNYASARLILGAANPAVRQFSHDSLASAPRGQARGLAGLPDAFPGPEGVLRGPWLLCSGSTADGAPWSTLSLGVAPTGQRLDHDRGLLVQVPDGRRYLVWRDTRLEITQPFVLTALGLSSAQPLRVTADWLNAAVAPGPDLTSPEVPGRGKVAPYLVAGQVVRLGQVQRVDAAGGVGTQYYVALADGLAPVRDAAALLLVSDPAFAAAYGGRVQQPVTRAPADITAAPQSAVRLMPEGFPEAVPQLLQPTAGEDGNAVACGAYTDTTGRTMTSSVHVGSAVAPPADPPGPGHALLPAGKAAVIRLLPHARVETDALFLLTDAGIKYPVPSAEVLGALGLGGIEPVPLPVGILDAIPTGPALDPERANVSVPFPLPDGVPTASAAPGAGGATSAAGSVPTASVPPAVVTSVPAPASRKRPAPTTRRKVPRTSASPTAS